MDDVTYVGFGTITKSAENDDGTLTFEASRATSSALDSDKQIADPTWAKSAMSDWFASAGNLREMHSNIAAGVGLTLESREDGEYVSGLVVDPGSVRKVKHKVLKGLSVGIAGARVVRDAEAPGGRIVGGQIVEVSLVDRPANPTCKLALAKAATTGGVEWVEELTETADVDKAATPEHTVVANPDDPDAADAEALEKAKKGKKAPPFTADDKPKADGDDADDSADDGEGGDKPAPKKKNPFAKAAGLDPDDLAAIVKAVIAELPAMQAATADLAKGADVPTEAEPEPVEADPAEKAAEPDLVKSVDDEMADIARAKRILADLAVLVQSEAAGFLTGGKTGPAEVWDLDLLVGVMTQLSCFVEREEMEAAAMAENTASGDTPVPTVMQLAATPDVEKTAEPDVPVAPATPSLSDELARRLDKAMKKARKAAAAKASTPETPAPVAVSTTNTEMLTKAVAAQVTADLTVQLGDVFTKAMGPVIDRVAEVETLLKSTPRPGGPAVTRVQPQVSPAQLVKNAEADMRKSALRAMLPGTSPELRAEINRQIEQLDAA